MAIIETTVTKSDAALAFGLATPLQESVFRPFMTGGVIIAGVCGLISGMAYANSLSVAFSPIGFPTLLTWAVGGAVMGALGGAIIGFVVDGLVAKMWHA